MPRLLKLSFLLMNLGFSLQVHAGPQKKISCYSYQSWPECIEKVIRCQPATIQKTHRVLGKNLQLVRALFLPDQSLQDMTWVSFLNDIDLLQLQTQPSLPQFKEWVLSVQTKTQLINFLKSPGTAQFLEDLQPSKRKTLEEWFKKTILQKLEQLISPTSWCPLQIWGLRYAFENHILNPWSAPSSHQLAMLATLPEQVQMECVQLCSRIQNHDVLRDACWIADTSIEKQQLIALLHMCLYLQSEGFQNIKVEEKAFLKNHNNLPRWTRSRRHFDAFTTHSPTTSWSHWWDTHLYESIQQHHGLEAFYRRYIHRTSEIRKTKPSERHRFLTLIDFQPLAVGSDQLTMIIKVNEKALEEHVFHD